MSKSTTTSALRALLKRYFDLRTDKMSETDTINNIKADAAFRGANLWVLVFAIFVASLGLNVNSTAVIIGAMLISPLMGPIVGMGLAVGINDLDLLKSSAKNFAVATVVSVITAAVFFLLSPYKEAQSELLARTSPTLYDVMIAFFGGAAGIVAIATGGKGNIIPGVAIATALMPPLCTAGYGLATGQWIFFFGAFYLFFINTVFISLATFIGVRLMGFELHQEILPGHARYTKRILTAIVVLTMVPAGIITFGLVRQSLFNQNVESFINAELAWPGTQIISQQVDSEQRTLRVAVIGREVDDAQMNAAEQRLPNYRMDGYKLIVIQGTQSDSLMHMVQAAVTSRTDYKHTALQQSQQIHQLEGALDNYTRYEDLAAQLCPELKVLYPGIQAFALSRTVEQRTDTVMATPVVIALVSCHPQHPLSDTQEAQLADWLRARTQADSLRVVAVK